MNDIRPYHMEPYLHNNGVIKMQSKPIEYTVFVKRDLMAQRLARRAEDREVPGSSPTQD